MSGIITRGVRTALQIQSSRVTSPRSDRTQMALATTMGKRVMKSSPGLYRSWSIHAPLIRACIDIRLGQLMLGEWDLVPFDRTEKQPDTGLKTRIREIFEQPNPSGESFGTFIGAIGEDMLVLDAGAIEKERMLNGEIYALWPADGAKIAVDRFWDGSPNDPRYYWVPSPTVERPLLNSDLIYMMLHRRSYEPVGISYLEILRMSIEAELTGSLFNARQIAQAAPDGIMDLGENVRPEQVTAFRSFFEQELAGKGMIGFWGGTKNSKFIPFRGSNREAQFIEFLTWEARKQAVVFQLSPQDIGLLHDVNKANAEVQQQNTEDRGARVFLGNIQNYLTTEVCWDRPFGGRRNNIAFRFLAVSDRASLQRAQELKIALAGMPYETINGGRMALGLQPIGDALDVTNPFNKLMANTSLGIATIDLVPNARELASKNTPDGGGSSAPKQIGPGKSEKAYEVMTKSVPLLVTKVADEVEARVMKEAREMIGEIEPIAPIIEVIRADATAAEERYTASIAASDERFLEALTRFAETVKTIGDRPIEVQVDSPVTIQEGAIKVESPVTVEKGAVQVDSPVTVVPPKARRVVRDTAFRTDQAGRIIGKTEVEEPEEDDG